MWCLALTFMLPTRFTDQINGHLYSSQLMKLITLLLSCDDHVQFLNQIRSNWAILGHEVHDFIESMINELKAMFEHCEKGIHEVL